MASQRQKQQKRGSHQLRYRHDASDGSSNQNGTADFGSGSGSVQQHYKVRVTFLFVMLSILLSATIAFSVGWITHLVLHLHYEAFMQPRNDGLTAASFERYSTRDDDFFESVGGIDNIPPQFSTSTDNYKDKNNRSKGMSRKKSSQLPTPRIIAGKEVPQTIYTSKTFNTAASATSNTLLLDRSNSKAKRVDDDVDGEAAVSKSSKKENKLDDPLHDADTKHKDKVGWIAPESYADRNNVEPSSEDDQDRDEAHLPSGQHLLVDIKNVDGYFLNSEHRLAGAMIELIDESQLTLLSYHCHSLVPMGVSCAGVLLESHVSFHTWPEEGVISLDLFTCGSKQLIPTLPSIERLFAVPGNDNDESPQMLWAHKLRGFREGFSRDYRREKNPLDQDLSKLLVGKLDFDMKKKLVSTETHFQHVDIYELIKPRFSDLASYQKSLSGDDSYESLHPQLYSPDRYLFLDGVLQSTLHGEAAYHESIVHPAMISHPNPQRVAIIGGGEGATLREVLKHKTVQQVVMIEIDEEIVMLSKKYLAEWSDCSSIEGSVDWCFDDPRATAIFSDAIEHFITHFGYINNTSPNAQNEETLQEKFDVIIMDALDPNIDVEFVTELYHNQLLISSLYNALSNSGILAVQLGETPDAHDPADEMGEFYNRARMMEALEEVGFQSMHVFEEAHSQLTWPWSTLVAFKSRETKADWYRNPAEIQLELRKRLLPVRSTFFSSSLPTSSPSPAASTLRYFDAATMFSYQVPHRAFENIYCHKEKVPMECYNYRGFPRTTGEIDNNLKMDSDEIGLNDYSQYVKHIQFSPSTSLIIGDMKAMADNKTKGVVFQASKLSKLTTFLEQYGSSTTSQGQIQYIIKPGVTQTILTEKDLTLVYSPLIERHSRQLLFSPRMD